jgi:hypothetical protein
MAKPVALYFLAGERRDSLPLAGTAKRAAECCIFFGATANTWVLAGDAVAAENDRAVGAEDERGEFARMFEYSAARTTPPDVSSEYDLSESGVG